MKAAAFAGVHVYVERIIHDKREPKAELAYFNRTWLNVHAIKNAFDEPGLGVEKPFHVRCNGVFAARTSCAKSREVHQLLQ